MNNDYLDEMEQEIEQSGSKPVVEWNDSDRKPDSTKVETEPSLNLDHIFAKLGKASAFKLTKNLYSFIPEKSKRAVEQFLSFLQQYHPNQIELNSEPYAWYHNHLALILKYKNLDQNLADQFLSAVQDPESVQEDMEQAFRHLSYAANKAENNWLYRDLQKNEIETIEELMKWEPTSEDQKRAFIMSNNSIVLSPEFNAARFMADGYKPTEDDIINATIDFEGDFAAISLAAHRIDVNEENRNILNSLLHIQEFGKFEFDVSIMPRKAEAVLPEYKKIAKIVQNGYKTNEIHPVQLDGKHCKGAGLLKDENTGIIWFLKPGSGKPSKAWGVQEEKASQSRREVAFNEAAKLFGLGRYVPESALLALDGEEVAVLQFFTGTFKSAEELKRDGTVDFRLEFSKYVNNGLVYKWAILDYVLGNPDRHGGNIMMDEQGNVKLIDAGSAFAGPSFNPAKDRRSWVPFYLRVFPARKWREMTPETKFEGLPTLPHSTEDALAHWVYLIDEVKLTELLNKFGIDPTATIDRLKAIQDYAGPKSEFIRKFYSNLIIQGVTNVEDNERPA